MYIKLIQLWTKFAGRLSNKQLVCPAGRSIRPKKHGSISASVVCNLLVEVTF